MASNLVQPLTDFATTYEASHPIIDRIFPTMRKGLRAGVFEQRSRRDATRLYNTAVGPNETAPVINPATTTKNYSVKDFMGRVRVGTEERGNVQGPLTREQALTIQLMDALQLAREKRASDLLTTVATYAGNNAAASAGAWSVATSKPVTDVGVARAALAYAKRTKVVGVASMPVINSLLANPQITGSIAGGIVPLEDLAKKLGIDEVIMSEMTYDSANPGAGTGTQTRLYGTNVFMLFRVPEIVTDAAGTSTFGAAFRYTESAEADAQSFPGIEIRREREGLLGRGGTEWLIGEYSEDLQVVQADCGFILTGV